MSEPQDAQGRIQRLREVTKKDVPYRALVEFLDEINSVEELDELAPILDELGRGDLLSFYRENLLRWVDPQLPIGFEEQCPRLTARLDTPAKVRILLRGADFRDVEPLLMGQVLEDIIRRHEVESPRMFFHNHRDGSKRSRALRIVYHTQLQARTLTNLALPGARAGTFSGPNESYLYVDWERP